MKTNKFNYLNIIQQHYGQGWDDVSEYEANSKGVSKERALEKWASGKHRPTGQTLLSHDLKEYKLLGYPTRVIFRKELNK